MDWENGGIAVCGLRGLKRGALNAEQPVCLLSLPKSSDSHQREHTEHLMTTKSAVLLTVVNIRVLYALRTINELLLSRWPD